MSKLLEDQHAEGVAAFKSGMTFAGLYHAINAFDKPRADDDDDGESVDVSTDDKKGSFLCGYLDGLLEALRRIIPPGISGL